MAAGAAALGYLTNDLAAPGLVGGLVLIVMLIGFTVMQFAFSGAGGGGDVGGDAQRRSLAMTGSGEAIFDWNVVTDEVSGSEAIESQLGLKRGALEGPAAGWLDVLHPLDRDRYTLALDGLLHQRSGRINHDLRLRGPDGHYFWYVLKARPVINAEGEVVRVIGSLADVTEIKSAEERMLHDAVHDNLTGLPNRELFYDRLTSALLLAQKPGASPPTALVIDIDAFKSVNDSYGLSIGDSALLAVARRVARDLKPGDTLARLSGDQFGAIVFPDSPPTDAATRFESLRAALAAPISFGEREIALTVSIGAATYRPEAARQGRRSSRRRPARPRQREEGRRRSGRDLRQDHAFAAIRPAGARERHTTRARSRGDVGVVPADRAPRRPHRGGLSNAGALASSEIRPPRRGRIQLGRRLDRRVRRHRRLSRWKRPPANWRRGRRRSRSTRQSSRPSPRARVKCSATIC